MNLQVRVHCNIHCIILYPMLFLLLVDEEDYFESDGIIGSYTKNIFDIEITLYIGTFLS